MTAKNRSNKQARAANLLEGLKSLRWLGVIVTWSSGADGSTHKQSEVTAALAKAGLDPKTSRELLPRHAFARAAKKMSEERVIDVFKEGQDEIVFQFTKKHLDANQWQFNKEAFITLNKTTGTVTSDDFDLAKVAQDEVDKATETRTTADITKIVQRSFEEHADLIPMRDAGGVYFVPQEHSEFADKVEIFLSALGGRIDRIPIPEGTQAGDKAIQNAVSSTMEKLIEDHMLAVKGFETNTRKDTISRAAEKIKHTRVKIEAYAHYLGERQKDLLKEVDKANDLLKEQVEKIGGGANAYTEYDWGKILDGKVHKLVKDEDFMGLAITVATRARANAKERGLKVRIAVRDEGKVVILQAYKAEESAA